MSPKETMEAAAHSETTIALSKEQYAEHMEGMDEAAKHVQNRPLVIRAYALDDPNAPTSGNLKTAHFIRHGQGFHNLMADLAKQQGRTWVRVGSLKRCCRILLTKTRKTILTRPYLCYFVHQNSKTPENPYYMSEVLDSPLTDKGRHQALALQPKVREMKDQPELVLFSPNCRALQTGSIVFENLRGKVPFLAHEMIREAHGIHLCDRRRPKSQQAAEFPMIDFSLLETEEDALFLEDRRESKVEVAERIYKFLEFLEGRSEKHVAISSHSAWLLTAFNANFDCDEGLRGWFQTGEIRSVVLEFVRNT